jgi:hypothetical protein
MKERRSGEVKNMNKKKKIAVWTLTRFPDWNATDGMIRVLSN